MQIDDRRFSYSFDRYFACDLAMYECVVNRSIFLAKNSTNSNFSITVLTVVVLSVDYRCWKCISSSVLSKIVC